MSRIKQGQLSGNVFIYLFALIVIGFILILGYRYISSTNETIIKTDLILLKNRLASDIESISSDYGSSRKVSYSTTNIDELCVFDLDKKENILDNLPVNFNLLIKDSIQSNVNNNAFIIGTSMFEPFYIGDIEINDPYYLCFKPIAGKISFIIEGAGNKALIFTE